MRRFAAALMAATLLIAGSYAAAALVDSDESRPTGTADLLSPTSSAQPAELDRLIDVFDRRVATNTDALDYRTLGGFYLERALLTGSLDDYRAANEFLGDALDLAPDHPQTMRLLARGVLALHQFSAALSLADSLLGANPLDPDALLVATDANLELGRTDVAVATLDKLTLLVPGHPAVLLRRAEVAHLNGDQQGAVALAGRAYDLAFESGLKGRRLAFYLLFSSDLVLDLGLYERAAELVEEAMILAPEWSQTHATNARVLSAQGRYSDAIGAYGAALDRQSADPEWHAARADLLAASGDREAAAADMRRAIEILTGEDPVIYGRSLARLYADHDLQPEDALQLATADLKRRQDILGYDTYAWALYRNGRYVEAADAIRPVIASGLQDAEAQLHAGLILAATGDTQAAVAHLEWVLSTNPGFHPLLVEEARDAMAGLTPSA